MKLSQPQECSLAFYEFQHSIGKTTSDLGRLLKGFFFAILRFLRVDLSSRVGETNWKQYETLSQENYV